jgi:hypothetical protein
MNKQWHDANPMPKNPTMDQRIAWHVEHQKHCACRPIPRLVQAEIDRRPQPGNGSKVG